MKKLLYIVAFTIITFKLNAQQCLSGGCSSFVKEYPSSGAPYTPLTSWQVLTNPATGSAALMNGGNYTRFNVVKGNTYEWTYCEGYGGVSTSWDAQLTLYDDNNLTTSLCFSTDVCGNNGNAPYISWTATFSGTVRLLTTAYVAGAGCQSNSSAYNKLSYRQITTSGGCSYSISPSSVSLSSLSGNGSIAVTASAGCSWTAVSNSTSWLHITSGSSGTSNGTINYSYDANGTTSSRTGTITIQDKTFTITQDGVASISQILGVDISSNNNSVNWSLVSTTGHSFAYIKATEGKDYPPSVTYFNSAINNANPNHVILGAYHYAHPENGNTALEEATYFLTKVGAYVVNGYLPPVLDMDQTPVEGYLASGHTKAELAQWVSDWCTQVYNMTIPHRWPILYVDRCRANYLVSYYPDKINQNIKLWIADYPETAGSPIGYSVCGPNWNTWSWVFHQYKAPCKSCAGNNPDPTATTNAMDQDVFYGTQTDWDHLIYPSASLPDLTITAGTQSASPSTVAAGSNITAYASEDNSGTASAGPNVVGLWLSNSPSLNTNTAIYLGAITGYPSLSPASNSRVLSASVKIPSNTPAGTYYLFFWADGESCGASSDCSNCSGSVIESDECNNFATVIINVTQVLGCNTASPIINPTTNLSSTSFKANWQAQNDAHYYILDVATDYGFTNILPAYNNLNIGTVTSYNVTGLSCNADYYFRVRSYNDCGLSATPEITPVKTNCCTAPSAPSTFASNITSTTFKATWILDLDVTGYYLDVATNSSFTNFVSGYNNLPVGNVGSYDISGLTCNTTYYYRVRANNICGSTNSNSINVQTLPCSGSCTTPGTPLNVSAQASGQTAANLSWTAGNPAGSANVTYYWVVGASPSVTYGNGIAQGSTSGNTAYATGLTCGSPYYLRVYANTSCDNSNSNYATSSSFTTSCTVNCPAPTANAATNITQTSFLASWSQISGATSYYFDVATDAGFNNYTLYNIQLGGQYQSFTISSLTCNTIYYFRVRAVSSCGTSLNSNTITVQTSPCSGNCTTPGTPLNVSAQPSGQTAANLSWSPGNPAGSANVTYNWVVGTSPTVPVGNGVIQGGTSATTAYAAGLTCGTTYYLRVYANTSCDNSNSSYATSAPFTTSCTVNCPAPTANVATNITQTSFLASWSQVSGATSYYFDVATDAAFNNYTFYNIQLGGQYQSFTIPSLTCNTTYYFRIRAVSSCGTSLNSNTITVTTAPCCNTLLNPPTANAASNITATSFQANWTTVTDATGYNVDVATDANFSNIIYPNLPGGPGYLIINGLYCGTTYYYRVRANNSCGPSNNSGTISVQTSACCNPPPATTANPVSNVTSTSFQTNWDVSIGATWYYLDVATDVNFSNMISGYNNLSVGNFNTYFISGLNCSTTYYYRIRASNSCRSGQSSNIVSAQTSACCTAPPAPVATAASNITTTSFQANWTTVNGASDYNVDVATDANFLNIIYNVASNTEYVNVNALVCNTTYYYRVRASNGCTPSVNSAVISVTTSPCCVTPSTPVVTPSGPINLCANQNARLSISNPCGGCIYHWSDGSTGLTDIINSSGSYYALAVSTCNQTSPNSNNVIVNLNSFVADAGANKTICAGGSVTIGPSQVLAGYTYSWSPSAGLNNPNIANPVANPAATTTYTLTETNLSGCTSTASVTVSVATIPILIGQISGNKNPCESSQQTYSVTSIAGAAYNWIIPAGWQGTSNTNSIIVTVGSSGPATIKVYASNGACGNGNTLTLPVLVNSHSIAPNSINVSPSTTICSGNSVQLTVNGGSLGIGATWNWYTAGCGIGTPNSSGSSITVSPPQSTNYFVTAQNGCGSTNCSSIPITVNQTPPTPTPIPPFLEVCADNQVKLLANTTEDSYLWNGPNGFTSTLQNPTVSTTIGGTGKYCLIVTRINCPSTPGCDSLKFDPLTPTSINIWQDRCFDSSVIFHSSITGGGASPAYRWQLKNFQSILWNDISNGQADTLRLDHASNGMQVRCVMASNAICPRPIFAISDSNLISCLSKKQPLPQIDCLKEFTVMPNPNTGSFNVIINLGCQKTVIFQLYNSNGQKVYERNGGLMNRQVTTPFQLGQLTSGIYFLKTWMNEQSFIYRIFIGH